MDKTLSISGEDIPIEKLVPLQERSVRRSKAEKLRASIAAVGLIEPLCVYPEGDRYLILDGYLRYRACQELKICVLPCLILPTKEAYTPNRMVNHLSPVQENRMLVQSLATLDEETIGRAFGLASIRHRIRSSVLKRLDPAVIEAFDRKNIPLSTCAEDLTFVRSEYQKVVLKEMEEAADFSPGFARTLVVRAPEDMRNLDGRRSTPWSRAEEEKEDLAKKLEDAEKRYDFFSGLYRQYVADLLRLCVHVRRLVTHPGIAEYLKVHHPEVLGRFQEILFETEGKTAT